MSNVQTPVFELPQIVLHRYFSWCDSMKRRLERMLVKQFEFPGQWYDPRFQEMFMYLCYWYGGLYVVVEGWSELGFHDAAVDTLLTLKDPTGQTAPHPMVDLLRRYRNGAFHFQRTYFDQRFIEFMPIVNSDTTVIWVRSLHDAFAAFFHNWFATNAPPATGKG